MRMFTRTCQRLTRLALCAGAALALNLAAGGCPQPNSQGAGANNDNKPPPKKEDGEPCAKDSECVNQCLTAAEAAQTSLAKPNTCGRANRPAVNP